MLNLYVKAQTLLASVKSEEEGQALVEYGILVALIAAVCIVAVTAAGTGISKVFTYITTDLAAI